MTGGGAAAPIDVLVVASWFPAYDDPAAGRFVADQVDALAATGAVRPVVVTFDPARLSGGAASRGQQAEATIAAARDGVRDNPSLVLGGLPGIHPDVAVTRLTIPVGLTRAAGRAHGATHRVQALDALADRLLAGTRDGPATDRTSRAGGVVHAHTGYPDGAAAIELADRLGWPLIVTEHASFVGTQITEPAVRERYAAVLDRATMLFAVSEMLAGELRSAFPERADRIRILPNAVPIDRFPLGGLEGRRPDELLFVGYWKASKGIGTLLRAVALARSTRPSIRLRLIGRTADAAEERGWRDLAAELGIADAVAFESTHDRAGVAAAMARASLFVHPSPRETFGVVAVEALATGTPVVATDSGGVTEILGDEPERLGALVPSDDPAALAEAILRTLDRRDAFDPAALRASVERRFGASFVVERLLLAYREALAGQAGAGASIGIPPAIAPATPPASVVVVALDRETAATRLDAMDEALRHGICLVSAAEPRSIALPAVGRVVEVDVEPGWRVAPADRNALRRRAGLAGRLARLVTDPIGTLRRRRGLDAGSARSLAPATEAIAALADELDRVEFLAVDGHDHLAIAPLVDAGRVRRAAGGLRFLADRAATSRVGPDPAAQDARSRTSAR